LSASNKADTATVKIIKTTDSTAIQQSDTDSVTNSESTSQITVNKIENSLPTSIWIKNILLVVISVFAMILFFMPKWAKKLRLPLLVLSVIVLGFWQSAMLSVSQFVGWLHQGIPIEMQWGLLVVTVLSIALPLFTKKKFYCVYVCPFGGLQELVGRLNRHKYSVPFKVVKILLIVRKAIFLAIVITFLAGMDLSIIGDVEPFSAFSVSVAPIAASVIAIVSVILSIFITKPWCRFVCPLGQGLDLFKIK
jgi:polyferredoxin